ncbi:hypothetical protein BDR22DRAFT_579815 [Usnea florida]
MKLSTATVGLAINITLANAYTGDLTHYLPGTGSCGQTITNGQPIVALSHLIMTPVDNGNANTNPYCGKQISVHNPADNTVTTATVADTCDSCAYGDLDVMLDMFNTIAPTGNGRVHGVEWTPIGWSISGSSENGSAPAQSSASPVAPATPSAALPTLPVQEKLAAVVPPSAAAAAVTKPAESPSAPAVPSSSPALAPSAAPPSNVGNASAPAGLNTTSCPTPGETICSADGSQIGTCTLELTVQLGPVAAGTKCVGGWMVMANSRLRSRRRH